MKPVIVINRLAIKPGTIDLFIEAQRNYASALVEKPTGLIGSHLYRGLDGRTVVLVSQFESIKAQEEISQLPGFKENLSKLQAFVESSSPAIYEEAYSTDGFNIARDARVQDLVGPALTAGPAFGESPRRLQENSDADHAD